MPSSHEPSERIAQEQILNEFRSWMLTLSEDRLAQLGVNYVEDSLRLLRGFATSKGLTHPPQVFHI